MSRKKAREQPLEGFDPQGNRIYRLEKQLKEAQPETAARAGWRPSIGELEQEVERLRAENAQFRSDGWKINAELYLVEKLMESYRSGFGAAIAELHSGQSAMQKQIKEHVLSIRMKAVHDPQTADEEDHNKPRRIPPVRVPAIEGCPHGCVCSRCVGVEDS